MMAGGINADRWQQYIQDIHRVLRPGGWCQMVEIYWNAQSDNGSLTPGRAVLSHISTTRLSGGGVPALFLISIAGPDC